MSALEDLWLWIQGRISRAEAAPDSLDAPGNPHRDSTTPVTGEEPDDDAARIRRNWRYRAGPWQLK